MNINRINSISQIYGKSKLKKVSKLSSVSNSKDVANISSMGKDFQTALRAVKKTDDIRQDKVDEIKNKIDSGEYIEDTDALVDKIMGNKKSK